ncbi:NUDIX domain-containing protein [Streptomyces sp. ODS28]|uniref:NUDIX hydrolase n=1 Tax=Streptomyces sp. ODS28 TaxID=3136688 RepID=UPI0031F193D8
MRSPAAAIGAHLLFERDQHVLLGRRGPRAVFAPDTWHLPAGRVEHAESARACAVREAAEELALTLDPPALELVHTVHLLEPGASGEPVPLLQLFFRVHGWQGVPRNNEPDKCRELGWHPRTALPSPLVGYARAALEGIAQGWSYTEMGWPETGEGPA